MSEFASAVLVGEHAFHPECLGFGYSDVPADGDDIFGLVVAVPGAIGPEAIGRVEVLVGQADPFVVDQHFRFVEAGRGAEDFADRHVSVLGDVNVDSGADGQVVE